MARISKGKFRYIRELYPAYNICYRSFQFGKHRNDAIQPIAKSGYYDGCRKLSSEYGIEIFTHLGQVKRTDNEVVELVDGIWRRRRA